MLLRIESRSAPSISVCKSPMSRFVFGFGVLSWVSENLESNRQFWWASLGGAAGKGADFSGDGANLSGDEACDRVLFEAKDDACAGVMSLGSSRSSSETSCSRSSTAWLVAGCDTLPLGVKVFNRLADAVFLR